MEMRIGSRRLGHKHPAFIIAEAGVNHNGDIDLAKKLIDVAVDAKVDAVKFQTFKTEDIVTIHAEMAEYQKKQTGTDTSQYDLIKKLELDYDAFIELKDYCEKKGIIFLSTPHSIDASKFLNPLVPLFKIGSGDLTNLPFLEKIAEFKKPIILSTGMGTLNEVRDAVETIFNTGNRDLILLHCVTDYPANPTTVNLRSMLTLKREFKVPVGFSDHTTGIEIAIAAVALGACVIEKHFTVDRNLPGPDHSASLEPNELGALVQSIRIVEKALGSGEKKPTKNEEKIMKVARKSIVAKRDIPQGHIITKDMIDFKRPGTGISPKYWQEVIGKKVRVNIMKDQVLTWSMIE